MKAFTTKKQAIEYCFTQVKPTIIGKDNYNRFRLIRSRYQKDPNSVKDNAIGNLFDFFGISEKCTYELDESKAKYKSDEKSK